MQIQRVKDRKKNLAFSIHSLVSIDKGSVSTKLFTLNEYARPSSPVRQDGERRTTFWTIMLSAVSLFSRFGSFFFVLTSDFQFIDAIINNARCACHP